MRRRSAGPFRILVILWYSRNLTYASCTSSFAISRGQRLRRHTLSIRAYITAENTNGLPSGVLHGSRP